MLSGMLKNRCVWEETGQMVLDEAGEYTMCGGMGTCIDKGTFCGKMNDNPNYNNSNLDNIFYAMLMVFQCTTLEGWSDL